MPLVKEVFPQAFWHQTTTGIEISHAVLPCEKSAVPAGEADISGGAGSYYGIDIFPHSAHFLNGATKIRLPYLIKQRALHLRCLE